MRKAYKFGLYVLGVAGLTGCAVGPNFKALGPPSTQGYATNPPTAIDKATDIAGGEAQTFHFDQDPPASWWTLFNSPKINELVKEARAHNPTLQAAAATLRERNATFPWFELMKMR